MRITSFGGADGVTGSKHLVELGGSRVLLDCGLFQGLKLHRERNWQPLPIDIASIDAVVLSHAHLDHSGWLPVLVRQGWRGPVFASPATRDLAAVLLADSAHLQEEDARRTNKYTTSRHGKALPLYTRADSARAMTQVVPLAPGQATRISRLEILLTPVGHLLGACAVTLASGRERIVFSGDLGRTNDLLLPGPERIARADVLLVEATYGNRLHPREDVQARLGDIIRHTVQRGGSVLLPSFAVGRAQALLLVLQRLKRAGDIPPSLPIFLDSPMAIAATDLTMHHRKLLRVAPRELSRLTEGVRFIETGAQSQRLARNRMPAVIISASGMATGGRVLHHLQVMAPDPRHHIVFPGFQVAGTRGARLIGGEREVKIYGEMVPVRAEVSHLEGFSGHADADELMQWLRGFEHPPRHCFVVHGNPEATDALRFRISHELGWRASVPPHAQAVEA
ncbi:MAG: MBL fold metallo-hydrolase [Aquincola sp.]|nr:MBL fold metallo-hydrolase [Aquincola sp.]MDH4287648.1 MBL fold metallo-hydrolase [Aquincola sp.]MDH5329774.1 MBL fold metallo-hydrolase [Aquincola sp.]